MPPKLTNTDPAGDQMLRKAVDDLLRPVRIAVTDDSPYPWRLYPESRFVGAYFRVTQRVMLRRGCRNPVRVKTVELGAVEVKDPYKRRGILKYMVTQLKSIAKTGARVLYVENVQNPVVYEMLKRDGDFELLRQLGGVSDDCFAYFP